MPNNLVPIVVKKEGVSDNFYKITEFFVQNGTFVKDGELLLCFETSKITIDVEAPSEGYVFFGSNLNDEVTIGDTIAVISDDKNFRYKEWFQTLNGVKDFSKEASTIKISKPAQRLIDQNNIDISVFGSLLMITKDDVEKYLKYNENKDANLDIDEKSVVIFGGGGHAKMCIDIIKQTKSYNIIGIIDDNVDLEKEVLDIPVIGDTRLIDELVKKGLKNIVLGVGGILIKDLKKRLYTSLKESGLLVPTIIHPSATIEPSAVLGEGNQIMQGAIIGSSVKIGNNCIINSGCIISHDTVIGDNVHIAPGAIIGGGVTIKDDTLIGMGTSIFLGLTIGKGVIIQNGVHIFKNVEDHNIIKNSL